MSNEPVSPSPDPELNAIEAALGSLVPARSRIDRDLVMFRAGQASVRPSRLGLTSLECDRRQLRTGCAR